VSGIDRDAPPAGEEIHLPGPSILPLITAVAITMVIIGTTINWIISIVGGVVLIVCVIRWVRDTRRDVSELPEQHR
jgi:Flp pilus assembly protein TadB